MPFKNPKDHKPYYAALQRKRNARIRAENPEQHAQMKEQSRKYYQEHKERHAELRKAYSLANKDRLDKARKLRYEMKKQEIQSYRAAHFAKNKASIQRKRKLKYAADEAFRLAYNLRNRLRSAIYRGTKVGSAVNDLGCSIDELKSHLESKFHFGMTWENWGHWHIDHIRPLASFDLTDREQFLQACHYTNLQPLWAKDNISKGARLDFVPSNMLASKRFPTPLGSDTAASVQTEASDVRT